jgi:phenylpropionate dioxygenase-like ring-hydroxylating dioxygenase large terminal subunit
MGTALRRYWIPALQTSDLAEPGGDPRRVELLGESFVAFRGTDGRVGFLDEHCPHRGASLVLGRVEECGLRCIYHGWKFDADGKVLETPNVVDPKFKERFKARAYPVREAGGLIWVYLGAAQQEPPLPRYPWFDLPESNRLNAYLVENANWVQVLEALLDSSHLNILHTDGMRAVSSSNIGFAEANRPLLLDHAPRTEAEATDFGFHYAAIRKVPGHDAEIDVRITAFIAPFAVANPIGNLWMAVVPLNDHQAIYYHVFHDPVRKMAEEPERSAQLNFIGLDQASLAAFGLTYETLDDPDRPRRGNNFKQDRAAIRAGRSFSGLPSFSQEDAAVNMSSGALKDRSKELLCPADAAIVRLYRTLIAIAKNGREGAEPVGVRADPMQIFGTQGRLPLDGKWQSFVPTHRATKRAVREA